MSGLQLQEAGTGNPVAVPPPLPVTQGVPASGPPVPVTNPMPLARHRRPEPPSHPDGFPPEKDLGGLGKTLVWFFGMLVFGGGLAGWFFLFAQVGQFFDGALAMGGRGGMDMEIMNSMAFTSLDSADQEDLAFLSHESGMDEVEPAWTEMPAPEVGEVTPTDQRSEDWPEITVTGIMKGTRPSDSRVILDGVLVRVGDSYRGIKVIQVRSQSVALEFKDEVIWLYSGQNTED